VIFEWNNLMPHIVHDLRAGIRKCLLNTQLLERTLGSSLESDQAEALRAVLDAEREMDLLVRRIGTLAEADRSSEARMPGLIGLDSAVLAAKLRWKDALAEAGAEFVANGIPSQKVFRQIETVLTELIGNSIRYRSPERPLRLEIGAAVEGDVLRVTVSDNGSGWDPAYADKLFHPLEKLDANRGGFGLGLAIARATVESAGGKIRGETTQPGARFIIDLPAAEAVATTAGT
jgi:signal transduction histidine kinase